MSVNIDVVHIAMEESILQYIVHVYTCKHCKKSLVTLTHKYGYFIAHLFLENEIASIKCFDGEVIMR